MGNRRDQSSAFGPGNRIRQFAGCSYVTDSLGDGNVLSRNCGAETVRFHWTAESRLMALTLVGGDSVDFRYDAGGRLVRKDVNGAIQRHFLWQGDNLLAELNSTATGKIAEYSYYPGLDNPHALIIGTTPYFAHADGLGNVIALTDSATPSVERSYDFDPWGTMTGGNDFKPFSNADRARYKGALWLGPEMDVYYMRARWYEPKTGRFLSEDPIGLEGGINPYSFAGNDPVNNRDPTGRDWRTHSGSCPSGYELSVRDEEAWCVREEIPWGDQTLQQAIEAMNAWAAWAGGVHVSQAGVAWIYRRNSLSHFNRCKALKVQIRNSGLMNVWQDAVTYRWVLTRDGIPTPQPHEDGGSILMARYEGTVVISSLSHIEIRKYSTHGDVECTTNNPVMMTLDAELPYP